MKDTQRRWRGRIVLGVVLIAAAVAAVALVRDDDAESDQPADPTAAWFKTAEVTAGVLTTTERVDGSVERVDEVEVLHRIEGEAPVASSGGSSTSPGGPLGLAGTGLATVLARAGAVVGGETTTETSNAPATSDEPTTTDPQDTTTTTEPQDTTTTTDPDDTSTTKPDDTTSTTNPDDPTTTTTPAGPPTTIPGSPPSGGGGGTFPGLQPTSGGRTSAAASGGATTARASQTLTSVTPAGTVVAIGDVIYTVESTPVVALRGDLPAWRTMSEDSDPGDDIRQLEASLVALGYDPQAQVVLDGEFDDATTAMVERWQRGLAVEATGEVALGSVVFVPDGASVISVEATVGAEIEDGDVVLVLAGERTQVVVDVPDGLEAVFAPGARVQLDSSGGTIGLLRSVERDGAPVVQAVIVPDAGFAAEPGATVTVTVTDDVADEALIVPAEALLSRQDGTYAIQVRDAAGGTAWHTVEVLGVSGGDAAVRGDGLAVGTLALLPV